MINKEVLFLGIHMYTCTFVLVGTIGDMNNIDVCMVHCLPLVVKKKKHIKEAQGISVYMKGYIVIITP